MAKLSRDAEVVAYCHWRLTEMTLTFQRHHVINPRLRASLDELTEAGLLSVECDKRGPMTWKPTPSMAEAARKIKAPKKDEGRYPMIIEPTP